MLTKSSFIQRFYELNTATGLLRIYDTNQESAKLKQEVQLMGKVMKVEDSLKRDFRPDHTADFKREVKMPRLYDWPFAVICGPTDMMLLLASDRADQEMWINAFNKLVPLDVAGTSVTFQKTKRNAFVATVYKWLLPDPHDSSRHQPMVVHTD